MSAIQRINEELKRRRSAEEGERERRREQYEKRVAQILRRLAALGKELNAVFPDEKWRLIDSRIEIAEGKRAYGECQPGIVVADESGTFYLAITTTCNVVHWWWAEPVLTASGACHWRIKDGQGEVDPRLEQIATWVDEKAEADLMPTGVHKTFRESIRQRELGFP